jgi:hypothetical protein
LRTMSRVGLSIDSSESCSSDLSDSEGSYSIWAKPVKSSQTPLPERHASRSLDWSEVSPLERDESASSLPLLDSDFSSGPPSYRSRMRRGLEELRSAAEEEELESVDETTTRSRHPRVNFRLCLMLCALTLVSLSLRDVSSRPHVSVRREEVAFPLYQQEQKRLKKELPKYYLPKVETHQTANVPPQGGSNLRNLKHRSNVALARSHESRPVFGQVPQEKAPKEDRKVERFVLKEPKPYHAPPQYTSWTSWLAGFALVCMVLETGYKEFRRCRIDTALEEERRL